MGGALWILPIRRVVTDSVGINDRCFPSAPGPSETEQVKDVEGSFNSPGGLF